MSITGFSDPKANNSPGSEGIMPVWTSGLRYEDMAVASGGVARGTSLGNVFTTVYNKSTGPGLLNVVLITLERLTKDWDLKLTIDNTDVVFNLNTRDLASPNIYGLLPDFDEDTGTGNPFFSSGIVLLGDTFLWTAPRTGPLKYKSSIKLEVKYNGGGTNFFRAGLVVFSE